MDKGNFKLITYDGKITKGKDLTLKQMQDFVGGYIEYVGNVICNGDGKMLKLPKNVVDSRFVGNIIIKE